MINETKLLQKYNKDIRIIVNRYLYSLQFSTNCSYYDDLISEATLAFLIACRSFDLKDDNLTNLQRAFCKHKIESVLRVYIWKMHNMGGYNNRSIDPARNITISDVVADTDLEIDDFAHALYCEDFSYPYVESFISKLDPKESQVLRYLMSGFTMVDISRMWSRNEKVIRRKVQSIRRKFNQFYSANAA